MTKLTYEARENHLDKEPELKKDWKKITQKLGKEIFDVLSKQAYNTSFETRQRDSYYQEKYRYYHDTDFYFALKTIKSILEKKTLQNKTIDKIISFINEIEALRKALDTSSIQTSPEELLEQNRPRSRINNYYDN